MRFPLMMSMMFAALLASAATDAVNVYYEGRLLTASGAARANGSFAATARAYASAEGGDALASKAFTLTTDAQGYFAQLITDLAIPDTTSTFYVGVQVGSEAEIAPRQRVNPAPYAISAATATRIESTGTVAATGVTDVQNLAAATSVTASDSFVLDSASSQVNGPVEGFGSLYVRELAPGDTATLDFLRTSYPGNLSLDHDTLTGDSSMSLTDTTDFFSTDYNQTKEMTLTAAADGVALITYRCYKGADSSDWWVKATIKNDDFTVCDGRHILTGGSGWQTRTFTVPVRKGNNLFVKAEQHRQLTTYDVKTYVKVTWTYVGTH